jgi:5-hydroxyisourate hydrolase
MSITTHVLDTSLGRPAQGIPVALEMQKSGVWKKLGSQITDADGRARELVPQGALEKAVYRLIFNTSAYFASRKITGFYPEVNVVFEIQEPKQHYHVPLLLSPYGYSTYRGS